MNNRSAKQIYIISEKLLPSVPRIINPIAQI